MNIEELSKSQLILLMILVNFVISIATGVLTVSLLDQAPAIVTQTVDQIVDHTIETVATGTPLATVVTPTPTTKTVVVSADDLLTSAVADAAGRVASIYYATGTTSPLIANATYLPKAHAIVTDTTGGLPKQVLIEFPDGTAQPASLSHAGATLTIYGFGDTAVLPKAANPTLVDSTDVKQAETVVSITEDGSAVTGIVSKIDAAGIHTTLPVTPAGTSAVDLSGNIVGISSGAAGLYYPADKITTLLNATSTAPSS